MATPTPTPMRQALSQQGRTTSQHAKAPLQSQQPQQPQPSHHAVAAAAATPGVSTPLSMAQAAMTPQGYRSSPQQIKKSPANVASAMGHQAMGINFDSPGTAAALGNMAVHLNLGGLTSLGSMGKGTEEERAKRLDEVISILSRRKGVVSEAGIERLAKKLGLECMWEKALDSTVKKTFIMAGSALELLIVFNDNLVESVSLAFPDSSPLVSKHASDAGKILEDDLKLGPDESPLVKQLDRFAANFERLANLDKLSVTPGLNLYEAISGLYECLCRVRAWELQKARDDATLSGRSADYLDNLVLCTRSGRAVMNERDRVGLCLEYWRDRRLVPSEGRTSEYVARTERPWGLMIGCSPLRDMNVSPVRISDQWIGPDIVLASDADEDVVLDWREPESTLIPPGGKLGTDALLGPRLPDVGFVATVDPPVHLPSLVFQHVTGIPAVNDTTNDWYDRLLFPLPPGSMHHAGTGTSRTITRSRCVNRHGLGERDASVSQSQTYTNSLTMHRPIYGNTLKQICFSHPRQLVQSLPYLRQYVFFSRLLHNSFGPGAEGSPASGPGVTATATATATTTTTSRDDFAGFSRQAHGGGGEEAPLWMDVTLVCHPTPRIQVSFPFGPSKAVISFEIRENGQVHILSQTVIGAGSRRRPEDLGKMLEVLEDLNQWCEYIRTRCA